MVRWIADWAGETMAVVSLLFFPSSPREDSSGSRRPWDDGGLLWDSERRKENALAVVIFCIQVLVVLKTISKAVNGKRGGSRDLPVWQVDKLKIGEALVRESERWKLRGSLRLGRDLEEVEKVDDS